MLKSMPKSTQPYLQLLRLDRPIGSQLLFAPCAWGLALGAHTVGGFPSLGLLGLFGIGSIIMRGSGCVINDMWDKELDAKVERTRSRPLANNTITRKQALAFLGINLALGLGVLVQLNSLCIALGFAIMPFVVLYPAVKRVSHWPQFVLGISFNWGCIMGYAAITGSVTAVPICLYLAGISWTILYDTIYAHQDKKDDALVGIKSTALLFGDRTKSILYGFAAVTTAGVIGAGIFANLAWPFYLFSAAGFGQLCWQIATVNLSDPKDCMDKFVSNKYYGALIFSGVIASALIGASVGS